VARERHNARPGTYPATLLTTGDHDDRVVPGHSFKFAAALQDAQRAGAPILLRVDVSAGHGRGKPTAKAIAEAADRLAFVECALGMNPCHPWVSCSEYAGVMGRMKKVQWRRAAVNKGGDVMSAFIRRPHFQMRRQSREG
jgi:hypothetical protein